ncbi:MAG: LPS assembly lipoprotein LptE [Pseudomonadota bacterium]
MKNLKWIALVFCALFFFLSSSCGYRFEGGGYLKDTVTQVAVLVLKNQSAETGAAITFTDALIQEIISKTDTKVVDEKSASAVLKGTIKSITFATLSRSTTESVVERRITAAVDLQLINKEGEVIWSVTNFFADDEYDLSENQLTDESNRKEAVEKIAKRMAEKLVSKLLTNF